MEDYSKEWFTFRRGKFTASKCHMLMGEKGGITTQTAKTYILDKVAEELSDPHWVEEQYKDRATQWGINLEPDASEYYSLAFNLNVDKPDPQSPEWCDEISCSPDGIVYPQHENNYGIEIKCPYNRSNHVKHMLLMEERDLKSTMKEYYWQVLMNMLIFEFNYYEFISYDPRFIGKNRMFVLPFKIENVNDDIKRLKENLLLAVKEKHRIINLINAQ